MSGVKPLAAQLNINLPQNRIKVDDVSTLLALHNFCLSNLKSLFEKTIANKKSKELTDQNNELFNFMIMVLEVMEDFQKRIIQNFYLNKELEENELVEKQIEEGQSRIEELNTLYEQVIAMQLAEQKAREAEFSLQKNTILQERKSLFNQLNQAESKLANLFVQRSESISNLESHFDNMIQYVMSNQSPIQFVVQGVNLEISKEKAERAIKNEFAEDLANGTLDLDTYIPRAKNVYRELGISELVSNNIPQSQEALSEVEKMAEARSNEVGILSQLSGSYEAIQQQIEVVKSIDTEVVETENLVATVREDLAINLEQYLDLHEEFGVEIPENLRSENSAVIFDEELTSAALTEDDETVDLFAAMDVDNAYNNQVDFVEDKQPDQDDFPPPPGDPEDNSPPDQPPPAYINSVREAPVEPSAPPEEVEYQAPSAPPPEDIKPLSDAYLPSYAHASAPVENSRLSPLPEKNEPQDNQAKQDIPSQQVQAPRVEAKASGSSTKDMFKVLGKPVKSADLNNAPTLAAEKKEEKNNNKYAVQNNIENVATSDEQKDNGPKFRR
jgi:hypothetical protein